MKSLSLIGCGKVGTALALLWHRQKILRVHQIVTRSKGTAAQAAEKIGSGEICHSIDDLSHADIIFLAVPDREIRPVCEKLACLKRFAHSTIFHTSGSVDAKPLEKVSPNFASIHPLLSFACLNFVIDNFYGTYCTIRGSASGIKMLAPIFQAIGAKTIILDRLDTALYHTGAVLASNYVLTLIALASDCLITAGSPEEAAKPMLLPLIQSVLAQAKQSDQIASVLTGPISRTDRQTIDSHLEAIKEKLPTLMSVYKQLGRHTLDLAKQQNPQVTDYQILRQLLE